MSRHAGFGAVATITEKTINDAIASYVRDQLGPFFLPLPTVLQVGPSTVEFSGLMQLLAPVVELHADPGGRVTVHFTFVSTLRAQLDGQPMQAWKIRCRDTVQLGLAANVHNERILLGLDLQEVVFSPLSVQVLAGPALPQPVLDALQSQELADAASAFVQALPPLTVSPPLLRSRIAHTQPLNLPTFSTPNWFTIDLSASNIVVKPMERAVTVGVDFQGFTQGDPDELIDLTAVKGPGTVYTQRFTQDVAGDVPLLSPRPEPKGGSIAAAVSLDFISAVVDQQVSSSIFAVETADGSGTPIHDEPHVRLLSVGLRYAQFNKPHATGPQDGLALDFTVAVHTGAWSDVDGRVHLQPYLRQADGSMQFVASFPDEWRLLPAGVQLDVPWWVDAAQLGMTAFLGVGLPVLAPMLGVTTLALLDGAIPSAADDLRNLAQQTTQGKAGSFPLLAPAAAPLHGLARPDWNTAIQCIAVAPKSIDLSIHTSPAIDVDAEPLGVVSPARWAATNKSDVMLSLKLRDDLERLNGGDLWVSWVVKRGDTKQVVAQGVKAYDDPDGNGILVPHHTSDLYAIDSFQVSCRVSLTVEGQVGEIWSRTQTLAIVDDLDRHRRFVQWGPRDVHFRNEGTQWQWWTHRRVSRIHRTAVSARCKMLREAAAKRDFVKPDPAVFYFDTLPDNWPWDELIAHRRPLCEYCFFGGPDKVTPFPEEDWF